MSTRAPALLLIDIQTGLAEPKWGKRNNSNAEANIARLLAGWRRQGLPVIHVQHHSQDPQSPLRPNQPGVEFKPEAMPIADEPVFVKTVSSAFIGTALESYLRERGIVDLVIIGLTTDHCVSTTTRMAGNLGFSVTLVDDATATFERTDHRGRYFSADQMHAAQLASLNDEFCRVLSTDDVLSSER